MSVIILFLLLPSAFSLLLYLGLGRIASRRMKTLSLLAVSAIFFILVISYQLFFSRSGVQPPLYSIVVPFTILAFSIACPVAIGMNAFPGRFSKRGELIVAALAPFISIPFVFAMLLSQEAWGGKVYGDLFIYKLPLIGWAVDPFTHDWTYSTPPSGPFPGLILYLGFFIEMTIVMLLFFWYCKSVGRTGRQGTEPEKEERIKR